MARTILVKSATLIGYRSLTTTVGRRVQNWAPEMVRQALGIIFRFENVQNVIEPSRVEHRSIAHLRHTEFSERKQDTVRHLRDRQDESPRMQKTKKKDRLRQPSSSFADCAEAPTDEDVGKDFGTLINAPLSKGGHFVFKSEKAWTIDSSQFSEFFTLDLKALSAAIDCVPFNEYIDVAERYFVSDQLTSIYNNAERGKAAYGAILDDSNASSSLNTKSGIKENTRTDQSENLESMTNTSKDGIEDLEEDLDFLLSLKEPVQSTLMGIAQPVLLPVSYNSDSKTKSKNVPNKPIDLEKWLDSVLDD